MGYPATNIRVLVAHARPNTSLKRKSGREEKQAHPVAAADGEKRTRKTTRTWRPGLAFSLPTPIILPREKMQQMKAKWGKERGARKINLFFPLVSLLR